MSKKNNQLRFIYILLCIIIALSGCSYNSKNDNGSISVSESTVNSYEETTLDVESETNIESDLKETIEITSKSSEMSDEESEIESDSDSLTEIFDLKNIPEYSDNPYIYINDNKPFFSDEEKNITDSFETYSNLDELGRCGVAFANISTDIMPTEKRGEIGNIKPSGWHTVKYNDIIADNYLYNRCHLIAFQLAGENANEKNLITGTRYMNVEGMLGFENKVADYVRNTNNHVLYRVTPVFENNNLVVSGVLIEAWSVEDKGEGICFNIYCYNVQPGIIIDYLTGDSKVDVNYNITDNTDSAKSAESSVITENNEQNINNESSTVSSDSYFIDENAVYIYVLNENTKKFHLESCSSAKDIKEKNKKIYTGTLKELLDMGYSPCKKCIVK